MLKSYRRVFGLILLLMILALPGSVLASRGGTDANGGHYDHTTGLYHYHHGYPAHQHENGICPYTGEKWELKIPEKPATLEEWKAQKHTSDETPTIDNETPENDTWDESSEVQPVASASGGGAEQTTANANSADTGDGKSTGSSAVPVAVAGAAVLAGAVAFTRSRKKKAGEPKQSDLRTNEPEPAPARDAEPEQAVTPEPEPEKVPEPEGEPDDMTPEFVIPEGTVIGDDGLPWEADAYAREKARGATPMDHSVATNFSEPKWGAKYSFCTDADGEEIHTLTCELAFIQINAADRNCPKVDCPICKPVRPDLSWYAEFLRRKAAQTNADKAETDRT